MKRKHILTFLTALCCLGMASCVKYNGVPQESPIKLSINTTEFELKKGDGGKTFIPTLSSEEEEIKNNKLTIEVKDKNIVTTDVKEVESGKPVRIKAVNYGSTTITVTSKQDKDCKGTVKVTVVETHSVIHVTGLDVSLNEIELMEGETAQIADNDDGDIKYTVVPINANNKDVNYSASEPTIASVDENGLITAVAKGESTVRIETVDKGFQQDITVKVKQDESLVNGALYIVGLGGEWDTPSKKYQMTENDDNKGEYFVEIEAGHQNEEFQMIKYNGENDVSKHSWDYAAQVDSGVPDSIAVTHDKNCLLKTNNKVIVYIDTKVTFAGGFCKYWVQLVN